MEHCLWGDRVFQVRFALLFITPNLFVNSKVILIKTQLVIKSKWITVTTKQLYKEGSRGAVRSSAGHLELLLWRTSLCLYLLQPISDIDHNLFIRGSPIFRPRETCSVISGFDGTGSLYFPLPTGQAQKSSRATLRQSSHFHVIYAHPCLFCHHITKSWTTRSMVKIVIFEPVCLLITSNESAKYAFEKQVLHILCSNLRGFSPQV